jgi:hypothetical protein
MSKPIFSDGIGYEGKVTLTLKNNNFILKSNTYKNNGTAQLFKFLGHCLVGAYEEAKPYQPYKLYLLKNSSNGTDAKSVEVCSSVYHTLAKTPTIISDDNTSQVKVIYSFEISKAAIVSSFDQVALYRVDSDGPTDFSAYYYLTDEYGNLKAEDVSQWSATTVLLIEWELSLSNKNTQGDQA